MTHLKGFGLENFRVFKEHTWFDFAPITLLIGPNSSGKSSLIKALLLLKDADINLNGYYDMNHASTHHFNFKNPILNLEGLPNIRNNKTKEIPFFLPFNSSFFKKNLIVRLEFEKQLPQFDTEIYLYELLFENGEILYRCNIYGMVYFDINLFFEMLKEEEVLQSELKEGKIKVDVVRETFDGPPIGSPQLDALNYFLSFDKQLYKTALNDFRTSINDDYNGHQTIAGLHELCKLNNLPFEIAEHFLNLLQLKATNPSFMRFKEKIFYLPSLKGFQKRSFRSNEDDILYKLIDDLQKDSLDFPLHREKNRNNFLSKWENNFRLEGEIKWQKDSKLVVTYLDLNEKSLVDMGFGISQLVAIILSIYKNAPTSDVSILNNEKHPLLILEEPEANLHPAFQSKLADMFLDAQKTFDQQFIIETHSEYMVRKFQYLVAKGEMKKEDIVIYYFHDPKENKQPTKIEILEDGRLSQPFGTGFYDETAKLMSALLTGENLN